MIFKGNIDEYVDSLHPIITKVNVKDQIDLEDIQKEVGSMID